MGRPTSSMLPLFTPSSHRVLLPLVGIVVVVAAFVHYSANVEAFVRRPNNGLMKLCPPGGQSFAAAWEITCGMRRRKRDAAATATTQHNNNNNSDEDGGDGDDNNGTRQQQKTEQEQQQPQQQMINNNNNRNNGDNEQRIVDVPEQLRENDPTIGAGTTPKSWWKKIGEMFFGRPIVGHSADEQNTALALAPNDALVGGEDNKALYRAPSMTEMMLFCCRFGCSLRDLMPYCDPFGDWDS